MIVQVSSLFSKVSLKWLIMDFRPIFMPLIVTVSLKEHKN